MMAKLRDLLAVIHRDGGHHTEAVGLEQSCLDAHAEIARRTMALDASESRERALREALDAIKSMVVGEARPRWSNDFETTKMRARIADIADVALAQQPEREG